MKEEINFSEMLFNRDERLLDYITNLQEENEMLNNECDTYMKIATKKQERIDKAYKTTTEFENWLQDSDLVARVKVIDLINQLQNQLQGEDINVKDNI